MEKNNISKAKFDKISKIVIYVVLSVLTILTCLLFVIQVQRIYRTDSTGDKFSREIVGRYIKEIIVPIILWIVFVVISIVINCFNKLDDKRKSKNSNVTKLQTLMHILPTDKIDEKDELYVSLKKESRNRKIAYCILAVCLMILAIFPSMYLFNIADYNNSDATAEVKRAVAHIWPFVLVGFILSIICYFYVNFSSLKSINCAKSLIAKYKKGNGIVVDSKDIKKQEIALWCIRGALILVAIIFIITGIGNGGPGRVYAKAAKICTECIGLG